MGSRVSIFDLHKFILFHLIKCIPFDLPHTIYLNILFITMTLRGNDDIYYASLLNKILYEEGVYQAFNALDEASKDEIIIRESVLAI